MCTTLTASSPGHKQVKQYPQIKALLNPVEADDGIFWVFKAEFFQYFDVVYLCAQDMSEFIAPEQDAIHAQRVGHMCGKNCHCLNCRQRHASHLTTNRCSSRRGKGGSSFIGFKYRLRQNRDTTDFYDLGILLNIFHERSVDRP